MHRLPVLLALAAVACGGAAHPGSGSSVDAWLVWTSTGGVARTEWIDATGTVRGSADGILVAYGDALYRVDSEPVAMPTMSCDAQNAAAEGGSAATAAPATTDDGTATHLFLTPLTGTTAMDITAPSPDAPEAAPDGEDVVIEAELTHQAWIEGGLGPFLFVAESTYSYTCGAHGNSAAEAAVFDVSTGTRVELLDADAVAGAREKARAAFVASSDGDLSDASDPATEIHLATSIPIWTAGGVAMRHLFYIDTCYACSDGEWSSYTRTTRVEDPMLPLAFATFPALPPAVATAITGKGEPRGVSWGTAEASWSKVLPSRRK
jgi:hypothetical protein